MKRISFKKLVFSLAYSLAIICTYYVVYKLYMQLFFQWKIPNVFAEVLALISIDKLPELAIPHYKWSIIVASLNNPLFSLYTLSISALIYKKYLDVKWNDINISKYFKHFILGICLVLAWTYSTYDYNLFYNQSHLIDRISLIALAVLVYYSPLIIFYFIPVCLIMISQFYLPLGSYSMTDKLLPLNILFMDGNIFNY